MLGGMTGSFKAGRRAMMEGPWDPGTDVSNLQLWIDASDTSSYVVGSGNNLTSITDKAGNTTLGFTNTPQRAHNAVGIGLPAFYASGNESIQSQDSFGVPAVSVVSDSNGNHWAIGVVRFESTDNTKDSFWSFEGTTRTYALSAGASNNTWPGEIDYDGSSTISNGNAKNEFTASLSQGTFAIVSIVFNKAGNQIFGRINGTTRTSVDSYDNKIDVGAQARFFRNRGNVRLEGYIAEYFHASDVPGTGGTDISDVEKAEGYLAHKWGMTGSLPNSHPYKTSAP